MLNRFGFLTELSPNAWLFQHDWYMPYRRKDGRQERPPTFTNQLAGQVPGSRSMHRVMSSLCVRHPDDTL